MKKLLNIVFAFLAVSCIKSGRSDVQESILDIDAEVDCSIVSDDFCERFETGNTIGIFVYHSENPSSSQMKEFSVYDERYKNVKATFDSSSETWSYVFENATTSFKDLNLLKPLSGTSNSGLAVVAYSPWIEKVSSITAIPFTLGGKPESVKNLMWARQNTHDTGVNPVDAGANYNIVPDGEVKHVKFTFQHAFSKLMVGFRCAEQGNTMKVSSMTLKRASEGKTSLPVSGNFNAMTGKVEKVARANSLTYEYDQPFSSSTNYAYASLLICPQDYVQDGDYILEFEINGKKHASAYAIKLADVAGGFKAGEIYTMNFTVGEDVVFDSAEVSNEWGNEA